MPDRPNPFEGVTDFFSELARMRSVGIRGGGEHGVEAVERTHASAWVPPTDILALKRKAHTSAPRGEDPWILRVFCSEQAKKSTSHGQLPLTPEDAGRSKT